MPHQKFTVFLIPDEDGYQVIVPHYPDCTTWGQTPQEAFDNAKEAMELILEDDAESGGQSIIENVHAPHVIVGEVDVEVPEALIESPEHTADDAGAEPTR